MIGVRVLSQDGFSHTTPPELERQKLLVAELGGSYHEVGGATVASALVSFATAHHATQLVLGTEVDGRGGAEITRGSVINDVIRQAEGIDVHVISTEAPKPDRQTSRHRVAVSSMLSVRWMIAGFVVAAIGFAVLIPIVATNSALRPGRHGAFNAPAGFPRLPRPGRCGGSDRGPDTGARGGRRIGGCGRLVLGQAVRDVRDRPRKRHCLSGSVRCVRWRDQVRWWSRQRAIELASSARATSPTRFVRSPHDWPMPTHRASIVLEGEIGSVFEASSGHIVGTERRRLDGRGSGR